MPKSAKTPKGEKSGKKEKGLKSKNSEKTNSSKIPLKKSPKVNPDEMLKDVSNTITENKKILKKKMGNVIDKKLNDKIIHQQNEIETLQNIINELSIKSKNVSCPN